MQNTECKQCPLRGTCPLRPMFYMDDRDFEMDLQLSEIQTRQIASEKLSIADENSDAHAFISAEKIRFKRKKELAEHKEYSQ